MRNLRAIAFRHLIKYSFLHVFISAVVVILAAILMTLIAKSVATNVFTQFFIIFLYFVYSVILALSIERALNMAKFLKSTNEYFSNQNIDEIYSSIKELDTKAFISLEKKYSAYKKEQREIEISKIKARLEAEREIALQKEQRIFDIKKEIEKAYKF